MVGCHCTGIKGIFLSSTSLSLPGQKEGVCAIFHGNFLFSDCLTAWVRNALMFSDRRPLIVESFLWLFFFFILWNPNSGEQKNKVLHYWNRRPHCTELKGTVLFMKISSSFCLLTNLWVGSQDWPVSLSLKAALAGRQWSQTVFPVKEITAFGLYMLKLISSRTEIISLSVFSTSFLHFFILVTLQRLSLGNWAEE